MLEGGAPYRDAWNIKGPGVYFLHALGQWVFGPSVVGLRILDVLWQTATALLLARIAAQSHTQRTVSLIAPLAYLLAYFSSNYGSLAQPDGFAPLPMAGCMLAAFAALESDGILPWGIAGACAGVAALLKLPLGALGLVPLAAALLARGREMPVLLRRFAAIACGALVPVALCAAYLGVKGAWRDYLVAQFVIAPQMAERLHHSMTVALAASRLVHPWMLAYVFLLLLAGASSIGQAAPGWKQPNRRLLLVWLAVAALAEAAEGAYFRYHFSPLLAVLALLGAPALAGLVAELRGRASLRSLLAAAVLVILLALPVSKLAQHVVEARALLSGEVPPDHWVLLGHFLRLHTPPGETIYVWGDDAVIYLHADRRAASRFLQAYFVSVPWRGVNFQQVFLVEFEASRPALVILLRTPLQDPANAALERSAFKDFSALQRLLTSEYQMCGERPEYLIYARTAVTACPAVADMP
jgi:hypothetical protein